jgi:hypothetical protein
VVGDFALILVLLWLVRSIAESVTPTLVRAKWLLVAILTCLILARFS